ncbi:MAG: PEP_CTERM-anchored TLD domain-containing protein [Acidobacteria bacterium]|nr:PEP_CTERM-anchored TLD domain-containing protein [Acidobacteriota bacterium]
MKTLLLALLAIFPLRAATIVNGGTLLNATDANQLATWLGQGDLTLTNIFSSGPDVNGAANFHAAADNKGATFILVQTAQGLVGGYNPVSWDGSLNNYVLAPTDAMRTAFLFNLTAGQKLAELLTSAGTTGQYQTYNNLAYGPTFGGGHDLYVPGGLSQALMYSFSYGNGSGGANLLGTTSNTYVTVNVSRVEAFTVGTASTPEPPSLGLLGGGLGFLVLVRKKGDRRTM